MSNSYGVDNAISKVPNILKKIQVLEFDRLKMEKSEEED